MKLKTQILVAVASASVLLMLLPGYADRTRPKLSSSTAKTSKHSNSDLSAEQTSSNRIAETSFWLDVTTPLVSGINHENHRGSAWCDYDNDGLLDLYMTHFGVFEAGGEYKGSPNQLLKNMGVFDANGDAQFEDVTTYELEAQSGLSHHGTWADIDNDGLPDLYVTQSSNSESRHSVLIHHETTGKFSDITDGEPFQEELVGKM